MTSAALELRASFESAEERDPDAADTKAVATMPADHDLADHGPKGRYVPRLLAFRA
ncbi:MAG TPA: hypothetical protein VHU61_01265 [Solirubrobacteraceae bacterium]|jgi:hypothetical protein|nr:hypothetical protein [Solirubrobacteraceae bacterium]